MKDAVAAQVRAATPSASSWVSANAGSGKTRVLTDRVARLLLAEGVSRRESAQRVSAQFGLSRNDAYRLVMDLDP